MLSQEGMRRVAPCLGVLTARMTPTAQASWKSWYVSAPGATRKTQTDKSELNGAHAVCITLPRLPTSHQLHEEGQQFFNELRYCLTHVELIGKHNNEQHGHKAHEHSADGENTFQCIQLGFSCTGNVGLEVPAF